MLIKKALGIREPGKAYVRIYPRLKSGRNFTAAMSAFDFGLAAISARQKEPLNTILMGGFSMYFAKQAKVFHDRSKVLEPKIQQILERARKIHFKK